MTIPEEKDNDDQGQSSAESSECSAPSGSEAETYQGLWRRGTLITGQKPRNTHPRNYPRETQHGE